MKKTKINGHKAATPPTTTVIRRGGKLVRVPLISIERASVDPAVLANGRGCGAATLADHHWRSRVADINVAKADKGLYQLAVTLETELRESLNRGGELRAEVRRAQDRIAAYESTESKRSKLVRDLQTTIDRLTERVAHHMHPDIPF